MVARAGCALWRCKPLSSTRPNRFILPRITATSTLLSVPNDDPEHHPERYPEHIPEHIPEHHPEHLPELASA